MNLKKKTYRELWTGDFDRDGIPNIDDRYPFDKNKTKRVNKEISLKRGYLDLVHRRTSYKKDIKELSKKIGASEYRVKNQYSSIGKQMGRNIKFLEDAGGLRVYTDNKKENFNKLYHIKNKFPKCSKNRKNNCIREIDNKYKDKNTSNYAIHVNLIYKEKPYEVQIKSKKMQDIQNKMHPYYKDGDFDNPTFINLKKEAKRLYKKGY